MYCQRPCSHVPSLVFDPVVTNYKCHRVILRMASGFIFPLAVCFMNWLLCFAASTCHPFTMCEGVTAPRKSNGRETTLKQWHKRRSICLWEGLWTDCVLMTLQKVEEYFIFWKCLPKVLENIWPVRPWEKEQLLSQWKLLFGKTRTGSCIL